jgi:hypothetical protein
LPHLVQHFKRYRVELARTVERDGAYALRLFVDNAFNSIASPFDIFLGSFWAGSPRIPLFSCPRNRGRTDSTSVVWLS